MLIKIKKVELSEPWKYNGSELSEIVLDWTKINGDAILELASSFGTLYPNALVPLLQFDMRFLSLVAGMAAKVNATELGSMWGPDFMSIMTETRNFLMKSGLEESLSTKA